jgi:hypothetical protein
MSSHIKVNFEHPFNAGFLRNFERRARAWVKAKKPLSVSPDSIDDPYYHLGTHPELVARLWREITVKLPMDCRWVVYGAPTLVHPQSGIIFAFAGGTFTYALRLPERERQEALQAGAERVHTYPNGSKFDLADIGPEWVFGNWLKDEDRWCLAAFLFAANVI